MNLLCDLLQKEQEQNRKKLKPVKVPENIFEQIQLVALNSLESNTEEYIHRRISRWYSEKFNTSLEDALQIPIEKLYTHFFESSFENMKPEDLEIEKQKILHPDKVAATEAEDEDWFVKESQSALEYNAKKSEDKNDDDDESSELHGSDPLDFLPSHVRKILKEKGQTVESDFSHLQDEHLDLGD